MYEVRRHRFIAVTCLALGLLLNRVEATTRDEADRFSGPPPGGVSGRVVTADGTPVPGVRVTLRCGDREARTSETDDEGAYCFCRVDSARDYTVILEKEGFAKVVEKDLVIAKRRILVLNVLLRPLASFTPPERGRGE